MDFKDSRIVKISDGAVLKMTWCPVVFSLLFVGESTGYHFQGSASDDLVMHFDFTLAMLKATDFNTLLPTKIELVGGLYLEG